MSEKRQGMYSAEMASASGHPIFDLDNADERMPVILMTYTQLMKIGYRLRSEQRTNLIRGYAKHPRMNDWYVALYDLRDVTRAFSTDNYAPWYSSGGGGPWDDPERE